MLSRIQARIVEFFRRPAVQSALRHAATAAAGAAVSFVAVHGLAGVGTAAGVALLARAVWVAVQPDASVVEHEAVEDVASGPVPVIPQTEAAAPAVEAAAPAEAQA